MSKAISNPKKPKHKIKTFDEYFQECIKNKKSPKGTPAYLKKALERAMREYHFGIKHEKYVIERKPKIIPVEHCREKAPQRKEFLRNHTNIKVTGRLIMACLMEKQVVDKRIVRLSICLKQK